MTDKLPSADEWATRISQTELPAFGQTLHQISALDGFLLTHAAELTRVVLRDPSMTARILKIANSAYFNSSQRRVNTVSRAVVVLGLKTLRSICLATALIDDLVKDECGPYLAKEVANAFQAALQARTLAQLAGAPDGEEVFISSLLHRLGALAFWSIGTKAASNLARLINDGTDPKEAEKKVLGFGFDDLTHRLAKTWQINEILSKNEIRASNGENFKCIDSAWHVVSLQNSGAEEEQWQPFFEAMQKLGVHDSEKLKESVDAAVEATRETLRICGAHSLVRWVGTNALTKEDVVEPEAGLAENDRAELQLAILRELTQMGQAKADVNLVLQLVLEALHRGAGIQRVVVGLLNIEKTQLVGKYVVEDPPSTILSTFKFDVASAPVIRAILSGQTLWGWRDNDRGHFDAILKKTQAADSAMAPLIVNKKAIGLFYIDQGENALSAENIEAFELFTGQAALCLQLLGSR